MDAARQDSANIHAVSYKRGGKVKRTGLARLHKGEVVVPRNKVKKYRKAMRRSGR
jgi:SLT domain-containing protein